MTPSAFLAVLGSLIVDTFRQALASSIFWIMLGVSVLCILFCASIGFTDNVPLDRVKEGVEFTRPNDPKAKALQEGGVDIIGGRMTYGFGLASVDVSRDRREEVHFFLAILAGGVAGAAGILLALIWTAGFLPAFLEPSAISVLLAKPAPRWLLLVGKTLGLIVFVGVQATFFVLGTWLALGMATGVWIAGYLWCIPLLILHFSIYASVSILLAVLTRSTVVCVFGSILFWLMTWGLNYGRHMAVLHAEVGQNASRAVEVGYWLMPKPVDLGYLFFRAMEANKYFTEAVDLGQLQAKGLFDPWLAILSSLGFNLVVLGLAIYQFRQTDY